ncbi:hypothetical protein ACFU6S_03120 [Streptomyces sp. NPDC057456]|uniref:hypothetical protein n=1 Tax=Streptomyces sp. NPDC057456 TaxID=3346139 RepID=UPI00369BDE06
MSFVAVLSWFEAPGEALSEPPVAASLAGEAAGSDASLEAASEALAVTLLPAEPVGSDAAALSSSWQAVSENTPATRAVATNMERTRER